jgi:MFS family permease
LKGRAAARCRSGFRRRALRLSLWEGVFSVQYATLAGGPLLAAFLLALGATPFQVGLVGALPFLGALAQPLGAEIVRAIGGWRRPVFLAGAATDVLLWPLSLWAALRLPAEEAIGVVVAVLAVQYAAEACTGLAWTSWASDAVPRRVRGRYFGRRGLVTNGLGAATAALAGLALRPGAEASAPVETFVLLVAIGMSLRAVSLVMLSRHPEPWPAVEPAGPLAERLRRPMRDAAFRPFLRYGMLWALAVHLAAPFFTVYMIRQAGVGAGLVMAFAGIGTLANLLGQAAGGRACDRWGDRTVLRVLGLVVSLQPLWWVFTGPSMGGLVLMGVLSATGGFAWGGHLLAYTNLMMNLAPERGKTSFFGAHAALTGLLGGAGPILGGLLAGLLLAAPLPTSPLSGSPLPTCPPAWLPGPVEGLLGGLKGLFVISAALRLVAWAALGRVPAPTGSRERATLRGLMRSFNPAQGLGVFGRSWVLARPRQPGSSPGADPADN